jgi:hypothetical protein
MVMHEKQLKGRNIFQLNCIVINRCLRRTVLKLVESCLIVHCFTWLIPTTAIITAFYSTLGAEVLRL